MMLVNKRQVLSVSNIKDVEVWVDEDFGIKLWPNPKGAIMEAVKYVFELESEDEVRNVWPIVRRGSKGTVAKIVQAMLICMGYPCELNGNFASDSVDALKKYQKDNKFIVNGIAGKAVITKMFK
jgi:hypothetical protein|nr:MAG TPA_asm: putative peptidoglycan binding domain protein [Caudoviricetes sp.]